MSDSFVEFHGYGYWAKDSLLMLWLALLVREIKNEADIPPWLQEVSDYWHISVVGSGSGLVFTNLDGLIQTEEQKEIIQRISTQAYKRLLDSGDVITKEQLNIIIAENSHIKFLSDIRVADFYEPEIFIKLLYGDTENDPRIA